MALVTLTAKKEPATVYFLEDEAVGLFVGWLPACPCLVGLRRGKASLDGALAAHWRMSMNEPYQREHEGRESASNGHSLAELTRQLSDQATSLARKEVELAKAEMAIKAKRLGIGAGAFGAAGLVGVLALGALTAALILALATAMDAWLAALIVTVAYGAIAGILALVGKGRVQSGTPPVPERAMDSTKQDVKQVKHSAKEARG
jgi:hypothetical protein